MKKEVIARILFLVISMINAFLTSKNINPLPLDENVVGEVVSYAFLVYSVAISFWYNNDITPEARQKTKELRHIKHIKKNSTGSPKPFNENGGDNI